MSSTKQTQKGKDDRVAAVRRDPQSEGSHSLGGWAISSTEGDLGDAGISSNHTNGRGTKGIEVEAA